MIVGPIERDFVQNQETCHSQRWFYWSVVAGLVALTSLVIDIFTLKQIMRNYVNAITALCGLVVDLSQLCLAIWLIVTIAQGWKE